MKAIPNDLLNIISSYSTQVQCSFHELGIQLIRTPSYALLEHCVENNHHDIIRYCISELDMSVIDMDELYELCRMCVTYERVECLQLLVSYKHDCIDIYDIIIYAIDLEHDSIVRLLVDQLNIDVEHNDCELLTRAVETNNLFLVRWLLDHPTMGDPYGSMNHPFITAIELQHYSIIEYMVFHDKVICHEPDNEPFKVALWNKDIVALQLLLKNDDVYCSLTLDDEERYLLNQMYL